MTEERLHRKRQYSRMVIRRAFLELLEQKSINNITVKEICDLADVNRTTFYSNYYNIYDLLKQIEDEFYQKSDALILNSASGEEALLGTFLLFKEEQELSKIMFGDNNYDLIKKLIQRSHASYLKKWAKRTKVPERDIPYIYEFLANGCAGYIKKWVLDGMHIEPEKAAAALLKYTSGVISQKSGLQKTKRNS